jgi:HK97 family phage prohead protease
MIMADSKKPYGDVTYADPKNGKYPIDTEEHCRAALAYISMPKNAAKYPMNGVTLSEVKGRIVAACKKFGIEVSDDHDSDDGTSSRAGREVERRFTASVVGIMLLGGEETRRNPDAPRHIGGYAAKWNTYSRDLGQFVEQLLPATYNKSRGDGWPDVICRFNHKDEQLLGTIAGGTLALGVDRDGLLYDVEPPESMRHVTEWVHRGDVQKSSHAFRCVEDEWSMTSEGAALRTIHSAQLVDVAPVVTPAYADTTAGLRSLATRFGADLAEVRSLADQHELRKFFVRTDTDGGARPRKTMYPAAAMAALNARRADPFG